MLAAYWHKEGLEIYSLSGGKAGKMKAEALPRLNLFSLLEKKVLIVGKERIFHTRKRYPSASHENIEKAVKAEIEDLFPLKSPCHCFKVFEKTENYALVDVWAWDCSEYEKVRSLFPFTHVLPEDLAFVSDAPEITVFSRGEMTYLVAYSGQGFLGTTTVKGELSPHALYLFVKGLGKRSRDIRKINLYGAGAFLKNAADYKNQEAPSAEITATGDKAYPLCLDSMERVDLKAFKTAVHPLATHIGLFMRVPLYILAAYGLSLYMTAAHYESAIGDIKKKTAALAGEEKVIASAPKGEDYAGVMRDINGKTMQARSPLALMDLLASRLPDDTFVKRLVLNDTSVELFLYSKEPLGVIESLTRAEGVKTVKLKGSPMRDPKGTFSFVLSVEMK